MATVVGGGGVLAGPTQAEMYNQAAAGSRSGAAMRSAATQGAVNSIDMTRQLNQQRSRDDEAKRAALWQELMDLALEQSKATGTPPSLVFDDPKFQQFAYQKLGINPAIAEMPPGEKQGFFGTLFGNKEIPFKDRAKAAFTGNYGGGSRDGPNLAALGQSYAGIEGERHRVLMIARDMGIDLNTYQPGSNPEFEQMLASLKSQGAASQPVVPTSAPGASTPVQAPMQAPQAAGERPLPNLPSREAPPVAPAAGNFSTTDAQGRSMGEQVQGGGWSELTRPGPAPGPVPVQRTPGLADQLPPPPAPVSSAGVGAQGSAQVAPVPGSAEDMQAYVKYTKQNPGSIATPFSKNPSLYTEDDFKKFVNPEGASYKAYRASLGAGTPAPSSSPVSPVAGAPASTVGTSGVPAVNASASSGPSQSALTYGAKLGWGQAQIDLTSQYLAGNLQDPKQIAEAKGLLDAAKDQLTTDVRRTAIQFRNEGNYSEESIRLANNWLQMTDPNSPLLQDPRFSDIATFARPLSIEQTRAEIRKLSADAGYTEAKTRETMKEAETAQLIAQSAMLEQMNESVKVTAAAAVPLLELLFEQMKGQFEAAKGDQNKLDAALKNFRVEAMKNPMISAFENATIEGMSVLTGRRVSIFTETTPGSGIFMWQTKPKSASGLTLDWGTGGDQTFDTDVNAEADSFYRSGQ